MDDKVPVHAFFPRSPADAPLTVGPYSETAEESKGLFAAFSAEVPVLATITDNEKVKIPTLSEAITAKSTNSDCRTAFPSVGKPNVHFNVVNDGVFVRVSYLPGMHQQIVSATFRSCFFISAITPYLLGNRMSCECATLGKRGIMITQSH